MANSSLFSTVSQVANTVGSSVTALFPSVSAAGEEAWYKMSINRECPAASTQRLVGDAYCNSYFVSDQSTLGTDPGEVFEILCREDNFEVENCEDGGLALEDTEADTLANIIATPYPTFPINQESGGTEQKFAYNPKVKEDSTFAKWIVSCALRESPFGYVDDRVAKFAMADTGNMALDTIVNAGIGTISMAGDAINAKQAYDDTVNAPWATGENCSSGEYAMYSRYSEDQRIMEAMGLIEESAVTAFTREYYKKNPLDTSLEGMIARYSGMSLAQANETLDVMAYVYYVATYKPEERHQLAFSIEDLAERSETRFEGDDVDIAPWYAALLNEPVYADVRNRTFVA